MIFLHGHVHCDAHPGNIKIRSKNGKPEIVLLDHGFYCTSGEKFRKQFCELWYSLMSINYAETERIAKEMGIGEYFRYLPLLFTLRTINSTKSMGGKLTEEEKEYLHSETEINLDKVGMLLQRLPTDMVFIFKAIHMVGIHNLRAGGTSRKRLVSFTNYACQGIAQDASIFYLWWLKAKLWLRLFVFEHCFWLFDNMFGFKRFESNFNL